VTSHARAVLDQHARTGFRFFALRDPDDVHVRTICAHCGATIEGPLGAGRAWFADHRASQGYSTPAAIPLRMPDRAAPFD
jgi:hypothetical protein